MPISRKIHRNKFECPPWNIRHPGIQIATNPTGFGTSKTQCATSGENRPPGRRISLFKYINTTLAFAIFQTNFFFLYDDVNMKS